MKKRKGIVLAGGAGSRLHPLTISVSKQLLPVYDKPMIYYPLSVLMLAGIGEIAIITTPRDREAFRDLLGNGTNLGLRLEYITQPAPEGLAQAYLLAEDFLDGAASAMVLGDNIFFGAGLGSLLARAESARSGACIFAHQVSDARTYGVVEIGPDGQVASLQEKPTRPKSDLAATGLYFLDHRASARARRLRPSARGELEITALLDTYLSEGTLSCQQLGRGFAWFDTGTPDNLIAAGDFIRTIETRQGTKIGCIEEIAYRRGLIGKAELRALAQRHGRTDYGTYLRALADEGGEMLRNSA
ncbi:MAG: glucose-1-phosphate thymidylyltransferase RfbA [Paracoccaceae bacterium]|nr:glucose-1-phosphate thymidylyltransferase RfbA [Paracoccaceae bacterium]